MIVNAQVTPARRVLHRSRVTALAAHALANGGRRISLTQVEWSVAGDCMSPHTIELEGRVNPLEDPRNWIPVDGHENIVRDPRASLTDVYKYTDTFKGTLPLVLVMEVPCRGCSACLRRRAGHWRLRCMAETSGAARTWFGTLTLSPEAHSSVTMQCELALSRAGTRFGKLSASEQFSERHSVISRDMTLWLKRVRKESGAMLRYCLVAEEHKSGLPHYHCLIHEAVRWLPVTERTLRRQWHLGFSKWNLVRDERAAGYVTKYLSKSSLARVRASRGYGKTA